MRSLFSTLLAAGCLWAAGCGNKTTTTSAPGTPPGDSAPKANEPAFGVKNIDGRYKVIGVSIEGEWLPETDVAMFAKEGAVVVKNGSWDNEGGKSLSTTQFKIDPSKTPAEIDFTETRGKEKKEVEVRYGIYKVEGDVLTVSRGHKARPKNFEPAKESQIMKLKRQ